MKKLKRLLSILLITAILIPMIPIGEIKALAATTKHTIRYKYKEEVGNYSKLESIYINLSLKFESPGAKKVTIFLDTGEHEIVGTINVSEADVGKDIKRGLTITPNKNIRITSIDIDDQNSINIMNTAPKITSINNSTISMNGELELKGVNLNKGVIGIEGIENLEPNNNSLEYKTTLTGNRDKKTITFRFPDADILQEVFYTGIINLLGNLSGLGDTLKITPESGPPSLLPKDKNPGQASYAYIIAENGIFSLGVDGKANHSVFFLDEEEGSASYRKENMAEIVSISKNLKVITIKVPPETKDGIKSGKSYEVQVTNKIKKINEPIFIQLEERKDVSSSFFVSGSDDAPVIEEIDGKSGPDKGDIVKVKGLRFDELFFINGFTDKEEIKEIESRTKEIGMEPDKKLEGVVGDIVASTDVTTGGLDDVLKIAYDIKPDDKLMYKGEKVEKIERFLAVYMGNRTTPVIDAGAHGFTNDGDYISVKTPETTITNEKEVSVIMAMQTEITVNGKIEVIVNIITNDNVKYTIIPSATTPIIDRVIPGQIQVIKSGANYALKEYNIISIEGEGFRVNREGNITKYPTIGIGVEEGNLSSNGIVIRKTPGKENEVQRQMGENWETLPGAEIIILNSKGEEIDGTQSRKIGNKIMIKLPKGIEIDQGLVTKPGDPSSPQNIYVYNPILGGEGVRVAARKDESIIFIDIGSSQSPIIKTVSKQSLTIDSGEEIVITGLNFQPGVRVFMGGVEVEGLDSSLADSGSDDVLKFKAPKFPKIIEGATKIIVMNLDGGTATRDFTYTTSDERDPTLTNFTPKSGTKDTVVVIDGDNFLVPNPSVTNLSGIGIYRLIGSRILMDGKDINEYNIADSGNIELKDYQGNKNIITVEGSVAELSDYAHSIILTENNNYYNIYTDNTGQIILSDGGSGTEETNTVNQYKISYKGPGFIADKGGQVYDVSVNNTGITLTRDTETINLTMQTPYKANGSDIYGSRVNVKDKNRIEFRVPGLTSKLPSGYTITVENPDTKKSTAKDLFQFYETVYLKPTINLDGIKPAIGSTEGGYQILIEGKDFEDTSKVYVDGVLVPQKDVKRELRSGIDTLIIASMPAYRRDMTAEGTAKKPVPIVVENGDGGTAISRFTYVIPPSAKPVIESATFQKEKQVGSAAGEEILTLTGKYFKFEEPSAENSKYKGWKLDPDTNRYYEDLDRNGKFTSYTSSINYDGEKKDLISKVENYTQWLASEVLPTVRIGGIEATIVEFGNGYIRIVTPQVGVGRQELYVVNNDFGTSNKLVLNFEGSNVKVNSVVPDVGRKQGGDSVEIMGTGFQNTRLNVIENNTQKYYSMPLVRFGSVGGVKDINNNLAQAVLENGDFTLDYNNSETSKAVITMNAKYNKLVYTKKFTIDNYNGGPIYLPVGELMAGSEVYPGYELVKVEVKNRKLIVEKGYSPNSNLDNPGKISVKTPSHHSIGDVQINVSNPDGGNGMGKFKYTNPSSKPKINNVTRDGKDPEPGDDNSIRILRLDYRGGQNITVLGEDFREATTIKIGDILSIDNKDIVETLNADPNKLAFVMPGVDEKAVGNLYRVTVINGDGATVSSDTIHNEWNVPIYIQFIKGESDPELGDIIPNIGPATGGTKVTIKGKDFRDKMEGYEGKGITVYFGDVEVAAKDIKVVNHTTLEVIAPPSSNLGPVPVKIENPDGTQTMGNPIFSYISKPKIEDVNPKKLFTNDRETVVTITGEQYLPGAKVILGGNTILTKDVKGDMIVNGSGVTGVDSLGNNIESSVVGGKEAATVVVEGDGTIKITFPELLDLENTSIIIINPDGGISEPYNDFKHEKPVPLKPMVLEGIPGAESTVRLIWSKSSENILNKSAKYEIYGRKTSDEENTFLGDTTLSDFLIKALEPNTEYEFLVRALNEYGAAIDFATVKVKTLSLTEDKKLKEKEEKRKKEESKIKLEGKEEIQEDRLVITIGSNRFKKGLGVLDISLAKYKDKNKFTIAVPIALARTDNQLTIKDGTMTSVINVRDLYTLPVSRLDIGDKDAYLRIHIDRTVEQHIPRGKRAASKAYELQFDYIYGKDLVVIKEILRNGKLSLVQDAIVYPNKKNAAIYVFNVETGNYVNIKTMNTDIKGKKKVILLSDR